MMHNNDFTTTSQLHMNHSLDYGEVLKRLQTMGENWEDIALDLMDALCDDSDDAYARQMLDSLGITEEDLWAWSMVDY